jgi:hypothetical protein
MLYPRGDLWISIPPLFDFDIDCILNTPIFESRFFSPQGSYHHAFHFSCSLEKKKKKQEAHIGFVRR